MGIGEPVKVFGVKEFYSTKCLSMGCSDVVCEEEG